MMFRRPLLACTALLFAGAALADARATPELSADLPLPAARSVAKAAPTEAEVGDVDSFGRKLQWLGVADASVVLTGDCSGADPETGCHTLPAGGGFSSFSFTDLGHITLPGRATQSLLCHWFSPVLEIHYRNAGATPVVATLSYQPTLTIENPVLDTPGLIDPTTGAPFGGRLTTAMTASERFAAPLDAGQAYSERQRDSALCIAGFLTRKSLMQLYGLSEAQTREFFRQPTTVRLNISGSAQHIEFASLYFGLRIVGD